MIQISTDMWVTLANPIKAVSDTIREVWVCENNVLSKVYPQAEGEVWWYLKSYSGAQREFHLCLKDNVPSSVLQSGKVEFWSSRNNRPYHSVMQYITRVIIDEPVAVPSGQYLFSGFTAANTWQGLQNLNISASCTSTNRMFGNCERLLAIDISSWDFSHVTDVSGMFWENTRLASLTLPNNFGIAATDMSYTFAGLNVITSLDATKIRTDACVNAAHMFTGCWRLTELDVSTFDTSNVADMSYMFSNMTDITTIYASSSFVTTAVTDGTAVFGGNSGCPNLVGGAGTAWNSSNTDSTYAHIDSVGNPGYFTQR